MQFKIPGDAVRETQAAAIEGRAGTSRIGSGIASVSDILPRTVMRFRKLYPEVELQMRGMPSPSQVSSLIESRPDAGILRMPVTNRKLISVPLFSEDLVLATPADVPYRLKEGINGFRNGGFIFVSPCVGVSLVPRSAVRLKVPGLRFDELGQLIALPLLMLANRKGTQRAKAYSRGRGARAFLASVLPNSCARSYFLAG